MNSRNKLGLGLAACWCFGYLAEAFCFRVLACPWSRPCSCSFITGSTRSPQAHWRSSSTFMPADGVRGGRAPWNRHYAGDFHVCQHYENACKKKKKKRFILKTVRCEMFLLWKAAFNTVSTGLETDVLKWAKQAEQRGCSGYCMAAQGSPLHAGGSVPWCGEIVWIIKVREGQWDVAFADRGITMPTVCTISFSLFPVTGTKHRALFLRRPVWGWCRWRSCFLLYCWSNMGPSPALSPTGKCCWFLRAPARGSFLQVMEHFR